MEKCPTCASPLCEYLVEGFSVRICWNCGHYESNSDAYKNNPIFFRDIVRENTLHFLRKFLRVRASDEFLQRKKSDEDLTEP